MLRHARPLIVPLICASPPSIAWILHKNQDSRDILEDEVKKSQKALASLLPSPMYASRKRPDLKDSKQDALLDHHLKNLTKNGGVTLLAELLNKEDAKKWNINLQNAFSGEGDKSLVRNNRGRLHCHQELKRDPYHLDFLNLIESLPKLQMIVGRYFEKHQIERFSVTQIQFLRAEPGSENQIWHRDNISPGLTLLIALDAVEANGPTELLLGSHLDNFNVLNNEHGVMLGCLSAGDAILYDARVIHRGRGYNPPLQENEGKRECNRPVLVLRWDSTTTPPPGAGLIVTNFVDYKGSFRVWVTEVQNLLQSIFSSNRK